MENISRIGLIALEFFEAFCFVFLGKASSIYGSQILFG